MLRVTRIVDRGSGVVTLRVERRIVSDWVDVLERECWLALQEAPAVRVDLGGVTFIDGRGVGMFRRLRAARLEVVNCSAVLQDLLAGEARR